MEVLPEKKLNSAMSFSREKRREEARLHFQHFVIMGKISTKRRHSGGSQYQFACKNPFHDEWESPRHSSKDVQVRKCILAVLSVLSGRDVSAICRSCGRLADLKDLITNPPSVRASEGR